MRFDAQDGQIGSGSRIGIVSFAETAVQDTHLITSVSDLRAAVDALSAGGNTNHADAFTKDTCQNVTVRNIKFVLPEDLDVSDSPYSICNTRNFKARFIAHYIDNDFECCDLML